MSICKYALLRSDAFQLKFPKSSLGEMGYFNFRAETELRICTVKSRAVARLG